MAAHENVPVFAPNEHDDYDLNMMRKKLRNLGLFLVFTGASIFLRGTPQRSGSANNSKNISLAFAIIVEGIILLSLSLVVHAFPQTAALVNAVLNHAIYFFEG